MMKIIVLTILFISCNQNKVESTVVNVEINNDIDNILNELTYIYRNQEYKIELITELKKQYIRIIDSTYKIQKRQISSSSLKEMKNQLDSATKRINESIKLKLWELRVTKKAVKELDDDYIEPSTYLGNWHELKLLNLKKILCDVAEMETNNNPLGIKSNSIIRHPMYGTGQVKMIIDWFALTEFEDQIKKIKTDFPGLELVND